MKDKKSQLQAESFYAVKWNAGVLTLLDQRKLPNEVIYRDYNSAISIADAIVSISTIQAEKQQSNSIPIEIVE